MSRVQAPGKAEYPLQILERYNRRVTIGVNSTGLRMRTQKRETDNIAVEGVRILGSVF